VRPHRVFEHSSIGNRSVRSRTLGLVLLIAAAVMVAAPIAAGRSQAEAQGKPAARQEITIAAGSLLRSFDPKTTTALIDYDVLRLVYDTLVSVDTGKPEPWAAESWTAISPEHWRFKVRKGITFSNGEPFDAEAVKFTIDRVLADPKVGWRIRVAAVKEMRIVDPLTIDFFLSAPVGNFPTRLSVVWIVPPKYTREKGVTTAPIGSGPFVVEQYTPSQTLTLRARKDYWRGAPKLSVVKIRAVPEPSTRFAALLAGDVDVATHLLPEQIEQVKSRGYEVISRPSAMSANLLLQSSRDTPVASVKVRQAVDYALDKHALFQGMTAGLGRFLDGQIVGPNSIGFDPTIHARPYDPRKAKQLLAEAGYPNGFEAGFDHPIGRYFRDKDVVEAIAAYLGQVGIRVKLNPMEGGAWIERLYRGVWGPFTYWAIQDAPAYDISWTLELYRTENTRKITADRKLDAMLDESFTMTDTKARNTFLQKFAQYVHEQTHFVALYQDPGLYGVNPKIRGIDFLPSTYIQLLGAYRVD
jgi:peptide/nickel transport system substrate-binding protein